MKKYWEFISLAIAIAVIGIAFSSISSFRQTSCATTLKTFDANRDGTITYRDVGIAALQIVSMPANYVATTPALAPVAKFLELDATSCNRVSKKILSSTIALIVLFTLTYIASALLYILRNGVKLLAFFATELFPKLDLILNKREIRYPKFEWIIQPAIILLLIVGLSTVSLSIEQQSSKTRASTGLSKQSAKPNEVEPAYIDKSNIQYKDIYSAHLSALKQLDSRIDSIGYDDVKSVDALAKSLVVGLDTELEKTYAIYRWVTANIEYDVEAYFSNRLRGIGSPPVVLKRRKAVCDGYSELMLKMGQAVGIKIKKIQGFAKGYGYAIGDSVKKPNHAWNAVQINGTWYLLDSTWDAGSVNKDTKRFVPNKGDYKYFLANPTSFIHSHFPEQPKWQLLNNEWSREEFSSQPFKN